MTPPTVLLIATTGEWTRRRVNQNLIRDLADRLSVPVYDVQLVGYPQRMRDWNAKAKEAGRERSPES